MILMKKLWLAVLLFGIIASASATEIEFSDDFIVEDDVVSLKDNPAMTFELPEDIDDAFSDVPENIDVNSIYVYILEDTPMIKIELTAHLDMFIFTYSPEITVTINAFTQEITDIELPWFARLFEDKILRTIQQNTEGATSSLETE